MTNNIDTPLVELNSENYRSILARPGIVLVDCWASSCGACKVLGPLYHKVAEHYTQHTFAKLDTLVEDELTSTLGIVHVPTLLLYQDGILLFKQAGNFDEARLSDIIAQAEALDMDLVRSEMERERSGDETGESSGT
jgi:thioredoxin 1